MAWLLDTNILSELRRLKPEPKVLTFVADHGVVSNRNPPLALTPSCKLLILNESIPSVRPNLSGDSWRRRANSSTELDMKSMT